MRGRSTLAAQRGLSPKGQAQDRRLPPGMILWLRADGSLDHYEGSSSAFADYTNKLSQDEYLRLMGLRK
jgi:hypothetical protein